MKDRGDLYVHQDARSERESASGGTTGKASEDARVRPATFPPKVGRMPKQERKKLEPRKYIWCPPIFRIGRQRLFRGRALAVQGDRVPAYYR